MLCENLTTLRKQRKLSQQRVSDMIKVSRTTYQSWENGVSPAVCMLIKLAQFHNTTIDELVK